MPDSKKDGKSGSQNQRRAQAVKGAVEPVIDLSGLTPEQEKYIAKIREAENKYDPGFVIGAPQHE